MHLVENNLQILNSIIIFHSIDMVNVLVASKFPTEMSLHHESMLKNIPLFTR